MLSAIRFNLDQSKILSPSNALSYGTLTLSATKFQYFQSVEYRTWQRKVHDLIPRIWPKFFLQRTDDSDCNWIHSSLTAVHCFDDGSVGKQPVVLKEYCVEYW